MSDKMFRVSHIGNITLNDIDELLEKVCLAFKEADSKELNHDKK